MWMLATALAADPPKNVVLADLGLHVVGVGYQRTVAPWAAVQADVDLYDPWTLEVVNPDYDGDLRAFVLRVRPVFWFSPTAPDGWWVSPFAQAGPGRATAGGPGKAAARAAAVGASAGYSGRIAQVVHLAFGLGGQYHTARVAGRAEPPSFSGFYPTIDGTVGIAF